MSIVSGIQIIGTQRSGSNLLRVILDQSPDIASPHPPHLLVTFMPLLHLYGDLSQSYKSLVSDVVDYVDVNPVPWDGIKLNKDDLIHLSERHDLFELNRLIYEEAAKQKHAKYWCCKSMANVHFARQLENENPDLKYIFLYRDGRDVAASFKKAVVGEKHIYHIAKQWQQDQDACLMLSQTISPNRFFSLSYESLLEKPEETIRQVCSFLNIAYKDDMLDFYTSKESKNTAEAGAMWENLKKPIIKNNFGKFRQTLSSFDIEVFETVAGETLKNLGYKLVTNGDCTNLLTPERIKDYDRQNIDWKKIAIARADANDIEKRKGQIEIINKIRSTYAK